MAGILSWLFTYPQDVIKSRIQGDTLGYASKYKGAYDCLKQSLRSEGYPMLFRGIGSTVVRFEKAKSKVHLFGLYSKF